MINRFSKIYIDGNKGKKSSRNFFKKQYLNYMLCVYHEFLSSEALDRGLACLVNPNSFWE